MGEDSSDRVGDAQARRSSKVYGPRLLLCSGARPPVGLNKKVEMPKGSEPHLLYTSPTLKLWRKAQGFPGDQSGFHTAYAAKTAVSMDTFLLPEINYHLICMGC